MEVRSLWVVLINLMECLSHYNDTFNILMLALKSTLT